MRSRGAKREVRAEGSSARGRGVAGSLVVVLLALASVAAPPAAVAAVGPMGERARTSLVEAEPHAIARLRGTSPRLGRLVHWAHRHAARVRPAPALR